MRSSLHSSFRLLGFVVVLVFADARPGLAAPSELVLAPAVPIPLAAPARELRVLDVSGDGILDLVAVNPTAPGVQVLLGRGGATFAAPIVLPLADIVQVDLGDVNGDGQTDLVTVSEGGSFDYTLQVHLGDGSGGFVAAGSLDVSNPGGMYAVVLFDADEDGDLDALLEQAGKLRISRGDGMGGFAAPGPFVPSNGPALHQKPQLLDIDGDGHLDVVGAGTALFAAGWADFLGDGQGGLSFSQAEYTMADGSPYGSGLGDFDGDHRTDFAMATTVAFCMCHHLYFAQGTGSSLVPVPGAVQPPGGFTSIRIGDLDGDGLADVAGVYTAFSLRVLLGRGDFTFDGPLLFEVSQTGEWMPDLALADVDGDEQLDVLVLHEPGQVSLLINQTPPSGWTDLGHGLAGSDGVPSLLAQGELQFGSPGSLKLTHANPNKLAVLFVGPSSNPTPFKGGMLVPIPVTMAFMLGTSPTGSITLAWNSWPHLPPGTDYFFQFAIVDSAGPAGASLSNAVRALQP